MDDAGSNPVWGARTARVLMWQRITTARTNLLLPCSVLAAREALNFKDLDRYQARQLEDWFSMTTRLN